MKKIVEYGPFRLPVSRYPAVLRRHTPLIKLDARISRIQLADKAVSCRATHIACGRRALAAWGFRCCVESPVSRPSLPLIYMSRQGRFNC